MRSAGPCTTQAVRWSPFLQACTPLGPYTQRRYLRYARSKLCNVLTSVELQRRARAAGLPLTTAAVSPGVVATGIWGNLPRVWRILVRPLARLFAKTPRQARRGCLPSPYPAVCLPMLWPVADHWSMLFSVHAVGSASA